MPAHQRTDWLADGAFVDRALYIGELGIEALRISNREPQRLFPCQCDQLVSLGKFKPNRLFKKNMLARQQAFLGHGVVRSLRRRRNNDRIDTLVCEQLLVIGRGRGRLRLVRDFLQSILLDLGDVQIAYVRTRRAGFGAYTTTPTRANYSDIDFLHKSST